MLHAFASFFRALEKQLSKFAGLLTAFGSISQAAIRAIESISQFEGC